MAQLDTKGWKSFRIGDLFDIVPTKGKNTYCLEDGSDLPYIAASRENNGVNRMISKDSVIDIVSSGNCLVFIHIGDAAAGYCHYIKSDFVGMAGKTSCAYLKNHTMTENIGLFFASIIRQTNEGRYSFGESWTGKRLLDTMIFLPSTPSGDPDWAYMDVYMGEVLKKEEVFAEHLASLTAEAVVDGHSLDTSAWKAFYVCKDLGFACYHGQRLNKSERIEGDMPFITAGFENRGVTQYIGNDRVAYHKPVTVDMFGNCFFQAFDCAGDDNVYFFVNDCISDICKMFMSVSIQRYNASHFSYARQFRQTDADNLVVHLPVTSEGAPDWAWMEQYMQQQLDKAAALANRLDVVWNT